MNISQLNPSYNSRLNTSVASGNGLSANNRTRLFLNGYSNRFDSQDFTIINGNLPQNKAMTISEAAMSVSSFTINQDGTIDFISIEDTISDIRANGLSKDIDYESLDKKLSAAASSFGFSSLATSPMDVADYFAATYSALKYRIGKDYSGDEYREEISRLDIFMNKQIDVFSTEYAQTFGNVIDGLEDNEKLQHSMTESIKSRSTIYDQHILNNATLTELDSSQDAWLVRHTGYITSQLRSSNAANVSSDVSTDLYSTDELKELSNYIYEVYQIKSEPCSVSMGEEELGLRYGLMHLKAIGLSEKSTVPNQYKAALKQTLNNQIEVYLDSIDQAREHERSSLIDPEATPTLNRDAIYNMINTVTATYGKTGNVAEAIRTGISTGYNSLITRISQSGDAARFINTNFWNHMFVGEIENGYFSYGYQHKSNQTQIFEEMSQYFYNMFDDSHFSSQG